MIINLYFKKTNLCIFLSLIINIFLCASDGVMTSISQFVSFQNSIRQAQGWSSNLYAEGVQASAAVNSVIGWQSAALPTSSTPWMGGNNVVLLDGARANYGVQVDGTGQLVIKDIGAGDANNGQSITVTGASYAVFNGGATASPGVYSQIMMIQKGDDATLARMYESSFGRMPDPMGYESWKAQLDSGQMSLQKIGQSFVQSPEFQNLFGANSTDQQFVDALYTNVLGRAADKAGEAGYTAYLGAIESTMGMTAARASLLVALASSPEEVRHSSSWLIDPSKGGFADSSVPIPIQTILDQGGVGGTIDLTLAPVPTTTVNSKGAQTDSWGIVTSGSQVIPDTGIVSARFNTADSNKVIIASSHVHDINIYGGVDNVVHMDLSGGKFVTTSTQNAIFLSGGKNVIDIAVNPQAHSSNALTVHNFKTSIDVLKDFMSDYHISGGHSVVNETTVLGGDSGVIFSGSLYHFNENNNNSSSNTYVLKLGSVGSGTAAEVASAVNQVYTLANSSSEHFLVVGQVTVTSAFASSGDTIVYAYGNYDRDGTYQNAELSHTGHMVGSDLSLEAKLVGVATASLTHANFGSGL
ncbi:MAG: DUF4214 domain-containing protein, partial [Methanobacterium sp.]|nr:DUF4214 domain-containing protein [Methanobacterium sp.]